MILANTIHAYPVPLMGGWPGLVLSMLVEYWIFWFYLRGLHSWRWLAGRFVIANVCSALVGIFIFVVVRYPPSGVARDNIESLAAGIGAAFLVSVLAERACFCDRSRSSPSLLRWRGVFMGNVISYALLVCIHLYRI